MRAALPLWAILILLPAFATAGVRAAAGPYRVDLTSAPRVVPIGKAVLLLKVTDRAGSPVGHLDARVLAAMPGMPMGEREQRAQPVAGRAGSYSAPATFSMAGAYSVSVKLSGPLGDGSVAIALRTGQDTGAEARGFNLVDGWPWLLGAAALAFVAFRMRRADVGMNWRAVLNRGTLAGVLLLAVLLVAAMAAVRWFRRPGSMTPIEAQLMEMNTPAPPGTTPVELATVTRGPVAEVVRYPGQAVGYVEQEVNARVEGVIVSMPFYVGDSVKKGQVLARLDTSQLDPMLAERSAAAKAAEQSVDVAKSVYEAALQDVAAKRAEVTTKAGAVEEAQASLTAASEERKQAQSDLSAMQGEVSATEADLSAAEEQARYQESQLKRSERLFARGFVSRADLQRAQSDHADAQARLRRAQVAVRQANYRVEGAAAGVRKAEAMSEAARRRVSQAQSDVRAAQAAVLASESAARGAKQGIARESAGAVQAQASLSGAVAERGYSALRAEVDGMVTERLISPGVLVNPGQTVLKVAQLSPIRLQANVATADLERIRVGSPVSVWSKTPGSSPVHGRVTSVSPSLDPQARTGVVEAVWPNTDRRFLPGEFVELAVQVGEEANGLRVPVDAVQRPEDAKPYVWVASAGGEPGQYTVNRVEVELGATDGRLVAVTGSLSEGQQVVVRGGTYLQEGGAVSAQAKGPVVEVGAGGYAPDTVEVVAGEPATITFVRRTDQTCGTEVVFPSLGIRKPLPLNKPVEVTFTPGKPGAIPFSCGMKMLRGKVVVR